mmetsp:Transcript_83536/g.244902  ORF Transcript_83536/g.244902 Transcript_83536/m.244902 type:complete len:285 (-) Transcript_83536:255-1109(-)
MGSTASSETLPQPVAELDGPPSESLETLSDKDIYVHCDAARTGLPIQYASQGFKEQFDLSTFPGLTGIHEPSAAALKVADAVGAATGLSRAECSSGMAWLERRMADVAKKAARAARFLQPSSAWVVRIQRSGEPIVCEMTIVKQWHWKLGWNCVTAIFKDVSKQVAARDLLRAAATGSGPAVVRSLKAKAEESLHFRGALLSVQDETSQEHALSKETRSSVLREALRECSQGPVTLQFIKGKGLQMVRPSMEACSGSRLAPQSPAKGGCALLSALTVSSVAAHG